MNAWTLCAISALRIVVDCLRRRKHGFTPLGWNLWSSSSLGSNVLSMTRRRSPNSNAQHPTSTHPLTITRFPLLSAVQTEHMAPSQTESTKRSSFRTIILFLFIVIATSALLLNHPGSFFSSFKGKAADKQSFASHQNRPSQVKAGAMSGKRNVGYFVSSPRLPPAQLGEG